MAKGPGLGGPELVARCSPVVLPLSRQARLNRLYKGARYKEEKRQLLLPLRTEQDRNLADALSSMLEDLVLADPSPA